jgi:hypothetical protein
MMPRHHGLLILPLPYLPEHGYWLVTGKVIYGNQQYSQAYGGGGSEVSNIQEAEGLKRKQKIRWSS